MLYTFEIDDCRWVSPATLEGPGCTAEKVAFALLLDWASEGETSATVLRGDGKRMQVKLSTEFNYAGVPWLLVHTHDCDEAITSSLAEAARDTFLGGR